MQNIIHAIIVSYNPSLIDLRNEILSIENQVKKIWIIDNASLQSIENLVSILDVSCELELVKLKTNLGLGAAQNRGIELARKAGATHILILDQDSHPMPNMVTCLMNASADLHSQGIRVAAVAPVYVDRITGTRSGFVRLGLLDYKKQFVTPDQDPVDADFVISSGSLIPIYAFNEIGMIDESLFIDHVDTEWCLRALSKGFKIFGIPNAEMFHSLGDKRKRVWFLRWRNVPYHPPFRYYYMIRNGVLLQKRPYIPWKWCIGEFIRHFQIFLFYGFWGEGSFKRLSMMLRGFRDGHKGVYGPMPKRTDGCG